MTLHWPTAMVIAISLVLMEYARWDYSFEALASVLPKVIGAAMFVVLIWNCAAWAVHRYRKGNA